MKKTALLLVGLMMVPAFLSAQEAAPAAETTTEATTAAPAAEVTYMDRNYSRSALSYVKEGLTFINSDVFFTLNSTDADTGLDRIEFSLDNAPFQLYRGPINVVSEGYHVLKYRGVDNGDNMEKTKTVAFYVDDTAPTSVVSTDRELFARNNVLYASAKVQFYISSADNDGGSGVKTVYAGTDINTLPSRGDGTRNVANFFSLQDEGAQVLYYASVDNVGNLSKVSQFNVVVDATAPVVNLQGTNNLKAKDGEYMLIPSDSLKTQDGKYIITANSRLGFQAQDNLSGVAAIYVKVNDEDFVPYFEPLEVKGASEYTIQVRAQDNVGNMSEPVTFTFKVDGEAPKSELILSTKEGQPLDQQ